VPTTIDDQGAERDHIFISYRRDDPRGASGRLYDWLRIAFGRERVFRDVQSIGVGKWREKIEPALAQSTVCVIVIGPRWANADNLPRLHDENDMVRYEIVTALGGDRLTVVPTLIEGAEVPKAADLPAALQPLFAVWNARKVTEDGWEDDTRRLVGEISAESGLPIEPHFDGWLRDAGAAQTRVAEQQYLQSEQIYRLRGTVDELTRKLAEASAVDRPARAAAFAALAKGNSLAAEALFEREYAAHGQEMAEAARNVANLALLHDVTKAVAFLSEGLAVDPDDAETARLLGHASILIGDLTGAESAFSLSLTAVVAQGNEWGE
jgi:TIR domain